jgi:hypothetical protein
MIANGLLPQLELLQEEEEAFRRHPQGLEGSTGV